MADGWELIASGDSTAAPDVALERGRGYLVVLDLPVAVPEFLAPGLAAAIGAAVGAFAAVSGVSIDGATVTIELVA